MKNKNKKTKKQKTIIKILVIDDDPTHLQLFEAYIEMFNAGCPDFCLSTTRCNNPQKLLEKKTYRDVDILITDYYMPNTNGAELIREIKKDPLHNITVFVGSSNDHTKNKDDFDADYFIKKTTIIQLVVFGKKIQQIMKKHFYKRVCGEPC